MTLKAELPIEQNETHNKGVDKKWKQFKAFSIKRGRGGGLASTGFRLPLRFC